MIKINKVKLFKNKPLLDTLHTIITQLTALEMQHSAGSSEILMFRRILTIIKYLKTDAAASAAAATLLSCYLKMSE